MLLKIANDKVGKLMNENNELKRENKALAICNNTKEEELNRERSTLKIQNIQLQKRGINLIFLLIIAKTEYYSLIK